VTEAPSTPATDALDRAGASYRMVPFGPVRSVEEAAAARGIPLEALAKTLVVRREERSYTLVLVPGSAGLDYKKLRAHLGLRRLTMPDPEEARAATGYERGTITPLGAGDWPVVVDRRLTDLPEGSGGAGVRGWAIHLDPGALISALRDVEVADVSS
jgi:Cys-tRNA(Pro) deacylase